MCTHFGRKTALALMALALSGCLGAERGHKPLPPDPAPEAGHLSRGTSGAVTYLGAVQGLFARRCSKCHTGSPYPDWSDYNTAYDRRGKIYERVVVRKDMPKDNATGMTADERALVAAWVDAGAPFSDQPGSRPTPVTPPAPLPVTVPTPVADCKPELDGALFKAVSAGDGPQTETLLLQGACPNATDPSGRSPLMASILDDSSGGAGYARVAKALLAAGANAQAPYRGGTPLLWASYDDFPDTATALLDAGADPNVSVGPGADDSLASSLGFTPLMFAVQSSEPELVNALLSAGANAAAAASNGTTAASLAAALTDAVKKPIILQLLGGYSPGGALASPSYERDIKPIIQNRCGACHNPQSPQMNWLDYAVAFRKRGLIYVRAVVIQDMPANANTTQMTSDERTKLGEWIKGGALK